MHEIVIFLDKTLQATPATTVASVLLRLSVAALLGGLIGMEREMKRRPAGLRTNLFMCFGAALFTILSSLLAGNVSEQARISSNIITGIGFIGAGSILHSRGGVQGLTTAATIFVVAGIGMCAGAGMMIPAALSTILVLFGLMVLGVLEEHVFMRPHSVAYQAVAADTGGLYALLDDARAAEQSRILDVKISSQQQSTQLEFTLEAKDTTHQRLRAKLRDEFDSHKIVSYSASDQE
jgi:putative Mg2+ transporter-C (MgtC) family protein